MTSPSALMSSRLILRSMILRRKAVPASARGMLMAIPVVVVQTIGAGSSSGGRIAGTTQQRTSAITYRPVPVDRPAPSRAKEQQRIVVQWTDQDAHASA